MDGRDPAWMTIEDVATALEVSDRTVRKWIKRGYLRTTTRSETGRQLWLRRSDVRAFAAVHYIGKPRPAWLDE